METKIYERLISLGYAVENEVGEGGDIIYHPTPTDLTIITVLKNKIVNAIKSDCNIDEIPTEIEGLVVDNIIGEFLFDKKTMGTLVIDDMDLNAVKSISEGDTTIQFADGSSQSEMLDTLIKYLLRPIDLSNYRRIRW